jgi:hypothetical protein
MSSKNSKQAFISQSRGDITRVSYNDRQGYAIVYYKPLFDLGPRNPEAENISAQRHQLSVQKRFVSPPQVYSDNTAALIRKKQFESASENIKETCANVRDLFRRCEQYDLSRREILNDRVREQIRGKSADEICDILVEDVMKHVKYIYKTDDTEAFPHKLKYKILAAAIKRAPSPAAPKREILTTRTNKAVKKHDNEDKLVETVAAAEKITECPHLCEYHQRVSSAERILAQLDTEAEIFERKYKLKIDRMRRDIIHLKNRCKS